MYCSPKAKARAKGYCSNLKQLTDIVQAYNDKHEDKIHDVGDENQIIIELKKKFKNVCKKNNSDSCWVEQSFVKEKPDVYRELAKNFRPAKPASWTRNKNEWLNTFNIQDVMRQYEESNPEFYFGGAFPIDFAKGDVCHIFDSCNFSIRNLQKNKKTKFGFVLNLDRHNEPGSHWVSLFGNIDPKSPQFGMCYFDSGGGKPIKDASDFMKKISDEMNDIFKEKHVVKYNPNQKQFKNTECGVFTIWFLALCLKYPDSTYREIRKQILKDDQAAKLRGYFWRP